MRSVSWGRDVRLRLGGVFGVAGLLHLVGWGLLFLVVAPQHPKMLGLGVLAYTLGLRHAFDADHIAAIDNTTRKFLQEGRKQVGVGFFFSLGHSTVVAAMALGLALATRQAQRDLPALRAVGGVIGTVVSGGFLYMIGVLNLVVLVGIWKVFRGMRRGTYDREELEGLLAGRGLAGRFFGRLFDSIRSSYQMYPIGLLFGLGFDTASEIALLALSAGVATQGMSVWVVLTLPVLFASGMCLMDTADGAFMAQAYGWAFTNPVRKVYYNLTVTGLSVAVALLIGTVELFQVATSRVELGGFLGEVQRLDFGYLGYAVVVVFLGAWAVSYLVWRLGRIEERWGTSTRRLGE
ncbi:HoxN/HupN/NixA family nickel/cobalt transporter [Rubrobacter calidifluminis]|uniref:HoxN/HupN/NixA family nickel/cobalt transporter n=1 Tax=Rubrobacter calidifluminis TaxID=1392640 RepID=UPI00235F1A44|nr:HoxN/HupN/NixA family nickel/cobalt transporter [Rubrobacter calidifluminis]